MDGEGSKTKMVFMTGAGGFIASWLVKRLLSTGEYTVHGTVRDLGDRKTSHLKALEDAGERLRLFKADGDVLNENAWSDEDHCRTTGVAFSSLRPRIFVDECGLAGLLTPEQFLEEHEGMLQELFPSCAVLPGSPTTCWASVALGAGVGIGAAFPECSYIFNGSPPKWSGKA